MVVVPAGTNVMGSTRDQLASADVWAQVFREHEVPQHMITIAKPFAIGKYEITRGQYAEFVKATGRPDPKGCAFHDPKTDIWVAELPGLSWRNPGYPQEDNHPVTCVIWDDAKAYVAWLSKTTGKNFRLPSEAEWEYAARAGATTVFPWGDGSESLCNYGQILTAATVAAVGVTSHFEGTIDHPPTLACATHYAFTRPVGSLRPNAFGIYDMIGNVVEMTEDCFHYNLAGLPADGSAYHEADCKAHSSKGGGIFSAPMLSRTAQRGGAPLNLHHSSQGFRVALDL